MSFFSVLIARLCGVNNFVHEELFSLMICTLQGNLRQKSKNPLEPHQYCQYSLPPYINEIYIAAAAGISTSNFALV